MKMRTRFFDGDLLLISMVFCRTDGGNLRHLERTKLENLNSSDQWSEDG